MWCDQSLDHIYFSTATALNLIINAALKVVTLGIYMASPAITPLFEAFSDVHGLKLGKRVLQFA
jgi:hypothetical protein